MKNIKELKQFLKDRKLLVLSTADDEGNPWTCNVYYSVDRDLNIYFLSSPDTKHGGQISRRQNVSFSVPWYNEKDLTDRKAVQGVGRCSLVRSIGEMTKLVKSYSKYYDLGRAMLKKDTRTELVKSMLKEKRGYVIRPSYMKFWNDELFGEEEVREFLF